MCSAEGISSSRTRGQAGARSVVTLTGTVPARSARVDAAYDSALTRELLTGLGFDGDIARKGMPAPVQAGGRVGDRADQLVDKQLRRCTERDGKIVDFYLYLAAAFVTIRRLTQRARNRYRWDLLALGQGDGHVAAAPPIWRAGLDPCGGIPADRPLLQQVLGGCVPQGLRAVLPAGRGHARRVREVLAAGTASSALEDQRDLPRTARQVHSLVAQGAHHSAVAVVSPGVPVFCFAVCDMHFSPRFQVQPTTSRSTALPSMARPRQPRMIIRCRAARKGHG